MACTFFLPFQAFPIDFWSCSHDAWFVNSAVQPSTYCADTDEDQVEPEEEIEETGKAEQGEEGPGN